jgi:hypothetical protein
MDVHHSTSRSSLAYLLFPASSPFFVPFLDRGNRSRIRHSICLARLSQVSSASTMALGVAGHGSQGAATRPSLYLSIPNSRHVALFLVLLGSALFPLPLSNCHSFPLGGFYPVFHSAPSTLSPAPKTYVSASHHISDAETLIPFFGPFATNTPVRSTGRVALFLHLVF